jgi:hypothetical protein
MRAVSTIQESDPAAIQRRFIRRCPAVLRGSSHWQDTASPVKSVTVLADEIFEDYLILQSNKRHVRRRWDGLEGVG